MTKLHATNLARMESQIDAEKLQSLRRSYRASRLTRHVIRPILLAIMVSALLTGLLSVIVEVNGDTRWFALILLFFLIALEAIYTTNWLLHPQQLPLDRTTYRAAELMLLLVVVRIASWIVFAEGIPDRTQFLEYLSAPYKLFLNAPFLITLLLAAITWRLAVLIGKLFNQLEVSEFELRYYSLPLAQRKARSDDQPIYHGRKALAQDFVRYWLWGGVLLVIAVGISTLEQQSFSSFMTPLAAGRVNIPPRLLGALILYFIVGLWLISQTRLMHLNSRWMLNNVTKDADSRRNWQRASLLILLLVTLVAAFLPIGSTSALSEIVELLIYWLLILANVIIFLLFLPFAIILALFPGREMGDISPPSRLQPTEFFPAPQPGSSAFAETLNMILSSGFWAVFVVVVALALLFFLRERRGAGQGRATADLWDQIVVWIRNLWAQIRGQARSLQQSLEAAGKPNEGPREESEGKPRWRFLRVRGLPPREQIRYFYLSAARRAKDRGVKRPPSNTPLEYKEDLKRNWPEAEEGLEELTDAFLQARYSSKPITEADVGPVKESWKAVRGELRRPPDKEADQEVVDET